MVSVYPRDIIAGLPSAGLPRELTFLLTPLRMPSWFQLSDTQLLKCCREEVYGHEMPEEAKTLEEDLHMYSGCSPDRLV